jgi:hypothetical protein
MPRIDAPVERIRRSRQLASILLGAFLLVAALPGLQVAMA